MKKIEDYLALPYTMTVRRSIEDNLYVARVKEIEGCTGHGQTAAQAISMLRDNLEDWIAFCLERGEEVPVPAEEEVLPSGKWLQRVSKRLHKRVIECASREGVSLNAYVTTCLAEAVGRAETVSIDANAPAVQHGNLSGIHEMKGVALGYRRRHGVPSFPVYEGGGVARLQNQHRVVLALHGERPGAVAFDVNQAAISGAPYYTFIDLVANQLTSNSFANAERSDHDKQEKVEIRAYA
jgi:predicted HicB family RNase H-like nuclease